MEKIQDRFLRYVAVDTMSNEDSETQPSAEKELNLLRMLRDELVGLGVEATLDEWGYVMASIPSNVEEAVPAIGFIAHVDTSPDASGADIKPQIIPDYDGSDVPLKGVPGLVLAVGDFPELLAHKGETLITTDGTTLLGADDKAGVAEIMSAVQYIVEHPEFKHGKICIGFTPDEEIARGAKHFDVEGFGADYGYTLDGSAEGEIQYENFNASTAFITIHGVSVHTGTAKDVLVNSQTIGTEFHQMLPVSERPETTEGYEGFYHLVSFHGNVTETKMKYFIRDFDTEGFHARAAKMQEIADSLNEKYGAGTVEIEIVESYYNMREKIEPCMQLIEYAKKAAENADIVPDVAPIRGGTDGARLSFKGLPCPNLGTGGYAFHGVYEHITVEGMDKAVVMVKDIVGMFAK